MSLSRRIRRIFGRDNGRRIRVHVIVKGRIGAGWHDIDETFDLEAGTTLAGLIARAERQGFRLREAIEASPHLRHTLMLNGERCPVDENATRELADGDEIYLLAPIAGG